MLRPGYSGLTQQALERAIEKDELILYYQPKVSLLSGNVIGAEALVRWNVGEGDIIPPSVFLPLAESTGLLHDITVRLLDQVVNASNELQKHGLELALSMNVAPNDLQSHTISQLIQAYLSRQVIRPTDLQIEITESAVMGNFEQIREDIIRLTDLGIDVLMDDFGTGYSSIDRLSQLPFSALKLDQGVVRRMGTSQQNLNVVKSSISMARELQMTSVAEGIESSATYHFLMVNGCEEAQGFFISHPLALNDLVSFAAGEHQFEGSQIGSVHQTVHAVLDHRKCLFDVLYCDRAGAKACLPSVAKPDIGEKVEQSRLGSWYFGIGQQLSGMVPFDSVESPMRDLHKLSQEILRRENGQNSAGNQEAALSRIDSLVNQIVSLLHALESALLLK